MKEAEIIFEKHIDLSKFSRKTIPRDSMLHCVIMNAMKEFADQQLQKKLDSIDHMNLKDNSDIVALAIDTSKSLNSTEIKNWFKNKLKDE